ncbi:MAG: aminodeoxychorismate synthase component I, partial [Achromobacter pestifer]
MECRFEDRLAGRARRLEGFCSRIEARAAAEVAPALAAIEAARQQGRWVALLLDYELGEWLLPEATLPAPAGPWTPPRNDGKPRLTALVFERNVDEAPWDT